jgi:hypothetical protein
MFGVTVFEDAAESVQEVRGVSIVELAGPNILLRIRIPVP